MKTFTALAAVISVASAFPAKLNEDPAIKKRMEEVIRRQDLLNDPLGISKAQTNCGPTPCLTFTEDQLVSVTGDHAYASPGAADIRGPCPGLNAAANHGYLPRNGLASIEQTVSGLGAAYNMAPTLATALSAYAIAITGSVSQGLWSIGGPIPTDDLTSGLLGGGEGLSYSHNSYEGDASIGRNDAYTNLGDAHSLNISKFTDVYNIGQEDGSNRYTLDKFRSRFGAVQQQSIQNNPYYFTGAFSTVVVVPAAYNFVINFMSNHSAEEPSGYLDGYNFKSFFGVTGEPGSFEWIRGQERIPENWYKRSFDHLYDLPDVAEDVLITYLAYPDTLLVGGNTGTTNSFVGVNLNNFTQEFIGLDNLGEGNNFACFAVELLQQGVPNAVDPLVNTIAGAVQLVNNATNGFLKDLDCPQIGKYDYTLFQQFPGRTYSPTGPDTNY